MQGGHQDAIAESEEHVDTQAALWLLASLAGFYRQPFDAELVIKRFPPPIDLPTLIEDLEALGLKAGLTHWPEAGLSALPLPAVALLAASAAETTHAASPEAANTASPQPPSSGWATSWACRKSPSLLSRNGRRRPHRHPRRGLPLLRIAIARALLKDPKVLIFDEAISNLDQQTAEHFAQTINRFKGEVTDLHHPPGAEGLAGG